MGFLNTFFFCCFIFNLYLIYLLFFSLNSLHAPLRCDNVMEFFFLYMLSRFPNDKKKCNDTNVESRFPSDKKNSVDRKGDTD